MVEAARRYGRVVSGGSQRVLDDYGELAEQCWSGELGTIKEVYVNVGGPSRPCNLPGEPVPPDIDWDMWLGPAPWAPYHPHRISGTYSIDGTGWRSWSDYSGGGMTDWGAHKFGGAMFAADVRDQGPVEVVPPDGKDHQWLSYRFANGLWMYHRPEQGRRGRGGHAGRKAAAEAAAALQGHGRHLRRLPALRPHPPEAVPRHRVGPSHRHRLPPGQYRLRVEAAAEVGPGQGRVPRRRRGQPLSRPRETGAVAIVIARLLTTAGLRTDSNIRRLTAPETWKGDRNMRYRLTCAGQWRWRSWLIIGVAAASRGGAGRAGQGLRGAEDLRLGPGPQRLKPIDDAVVAAHGDAAARKELETRLAAVLKTGASRDAKDFVCRKLMIIGTAESVPALAGLLADKDLSHMARFALERIPGPEAAQALRDALPKTRRGVEDRRDRLARRPPRRGERAGPWSRCSATPIQAVARAAAAALGRIGTPEAAEALGRLLLRRADRTPSETCSKPCGRLAWPAPSGCWPTAERPARC